MEEHVKTARIFLDESDVLFDDGDVLQGSEKAWGAVAHAMMAVAQQRGWPYDSHGRLKRAAAILSEESGDPSIGDRFAVAEKFHINLYHHGMEDFQVAGDRPRVRALVERLLSLYIGNGGNGGGGQVVENGRDPAKFPQKPHIPLTVGGTAALQSGGRPSIPPPNCLSPRLRNSRLAILPNQGPISKQHFGGSSPFGKRESRGFSPTQGSPPNFEMDS